MKPIVVDIPKPYVGKQRVRISFEINGGEYETEIIVTPPEAVTQVIVEDDPDYKVRRRV